MNEIQQVEWVQNVPDLVPIPIRLERLLRVLERGNFSSTASAESSERGADPLRRETPGRPTHKVRVPAHGTADGRRHPAGETGATPLPGEGKN